MAKKKDTCDAPGCHESLYDENGRLTGNKSRKLCKKCVAHYYRWNGRSAGERRERQDKLRFWTNRFDWMFEETRRK